MNLLKISNFKFFALATLPLLASCASWNTATISNGLKNGSLTYAQAEEALNNGGNVKESWAGKCLLEEAAKQERQDLIDLFVKKGGVSCFEADAGYKNEAFSLFMYAYKKQDEDIPPLADGRTLEEKQAIIEQDSTFFDNGVSQFLPTKLDAKGNINNVLSKQALEHYINYAVSMSEQAVEQLKQGSIVPSPYDKECSYCKFRGLCPNEEGQGRQIEKVKEQTITGAFDSAIANQMISKGEE